MWRILTGNAYVYGTEGSLHRATLLFFVTPLKSSVRLASLRPSFIPKACEIQAADPSSHHLSIAPSRAHSPNTLWATVIFDGTISRSFKLQYHQDFRKQAYSTIKTASLTISKVSKGEAQSTHPARLAPYQLCGIEKLTLKVYVDNLNWGLWDVVSVLHVLPAQSSLA